MARQPGAASMHMADSVPTGIYAFDFYRWPNIVTINHFTEITMNNKRSRLYTVGDYRLSFGLYMGPAPCSQGAVQQQASHQPV